MISAAPTRAAADRGPLRNACKLCSPLGASLVFRGIEGAVPLLHGSQGCATYIRRYLISHFREPLDIASSSFGETTAIFGGRDKLHQALDNVRRQYQPKLIGIATTCLSETIGDDVAQYLREYRRAHESEELPLLVHAATPSYAGSHVEGFRAAARAVVATTARGGESGSHVNLFPGFVTPADLRHLKEILRDFGLDGVVFPDYSDTLDGPAWEEYRMIPEGGTPLSDLERLGRAAVTLEFLAAGDPAATPGAELTKRFGVARQILPPPLGIEATDQFFRLLESLSGQPTPTEHAAERGRLVDALIDGHKHVAGKRAVVYGEPDLVLALCGFLAEVGIKPVLCATGAEPGTLAGKLERLATGNTATAEPIEAAEGVDFTEIEEAALRLQPDLLIGNSRGHAIARRLRVPLVRVGFPVHDRLGGARQLLVGYRGALRFFDQVANALIENAQESSGLGYSYM